MSYQIGQLGYVNPTFLPPADPLYVVPNAPPIPYEGFGDLPPPAYEQAISVDEGRVLLRN